MDSADYTLAKCAAWEKERTILTMEIGQDLTLSAVMDKILERESSWVAFAKFCEEVMLRKEDAERARRGKAPRAGRLGTGAARGRGRRRGFRVARGHTHRRANQGGRR